MLHAEEARDLFAYDAWANERMARMLERTASIAPEIVRIFAHVVAAEELWHARVAGEEYRSIAVWPETDVRVSARRLEAAERRWSESARAWSDADLARRVAFTNTRGEPCEDEIGDIARQVVLHGVHHRAQIALLLRLGGIEPANLDYIMWRRQQSRGEA